MQFKRSVAIAFLLSGIILIGAQLPFFNNKSSDIKTLNQNISLSDPSNQAISIGNQLIVKTASEELNELPSKSCVAIQGSGRDFIQNLNGSEYFIPASAMKILTAAVVLSTLKPDSTLDTSLYGQVKSKNLTNGYIKTSGDPSFVRSLEPASRRKPFLSPDKTRTFDAFAKGIKNAGVNKIDNLVVDNTWFGLDQIEAGWADDKGIVGSLAALSVDEGFSNNQLAESADQNGAQALRDSLVANGITVGSISFGVIPTTINNSSNLVAKTQSASVKELVSEMLKTSNNVYAEQLLAASVHVESGKVTEQSREDFFNSKLSKLVASLEGFKFVNASGYTREAKVSCELLIEVLNVMSEKEIEISDMSSIAGKDGTLTERFTFASNEVSAKTGTLDGVTALSGDIANKLDFSFISNSSFTQTQGYSYQDLVVKVLEKLVDKQELKL